MDADEIELDRLRLHEQSPQRAHPIDHVRWVPIEMVIQNSYNPNAVASKELQLLYVSIKQDGYTQPVVTIWDAALDKFVIVDGFHRYHVAKTFPDIRESLNGLLPIVVLDKSPNERMAATIRHNRARGEHSIDGMAKIVFEMLENGWTDPEICNNLGLEPDELLKLKHITGFSALFANTEYSRSWETKKMVRLRQQAGEQSNNGR